MLRLNEFSSFIIPNSNTNAFAKYHEKTEKKRERAEMKC